MDKLLFLRTASTAAVDVAMAVGVGCAIFGTWLQGWTDEEAAAARERLRALHVAASGGLLAGAVGMLLALVGGFSGAGNFTELRAAMPDVLATPPGRDAEGLVVVALALVVVCLLWMASQRVAASAVARLISRLLWLAAIALRASWGHAAENGPWTAAVAWQLVHLLTISVWSGSVLVVAWMMRSIAEPERAEPQRADPQLARALVASLSRVATVALGGVVLSGAAKSWLALAPAPHLLPLEPWTRTLGLKLAAVLVALTCALRSRGLLLVPKWGRDEERRCRRNLGVESIAMLVILSLSALLGGIAPPGE